MMPPPFCFRYGVDRVIGHSRGNLSDCGHLSSQIGEYQQWRAAD